MDKDKLTNAVAGFQHGNANAFNTIDELTTGSLYVYARSLMSDQAQAEDLLQNTYLQILRASAACVIRGRFSPGPSA